MGLVAREAEVPAYRFHCVHLAGLGGRAQVLAQPGGEGGVLALPEDPDVGGGEPGADPRVLAAEQQVHARRLAGDVLADGGRGAGDGAGVGGGVLAVLAQGAVGPPAAPVEPGRTAPEAPPRWTLGTCALNTRSRMFLVPV